MGMAQREPALLTKMSRLDIWLAAASIEDWSSTSRARVSMPRVASPLFWKGFELWHKHASQLYGMRLRERHPDCRLSSS